MDTEGCFRPERLAQIASSIVDQFQGRHLDDESDDVSSSFTQKSVMENVHLLLILDSCEFISLIHYHLDHFLRTHPKVLLFSINIIQRPQMTQNNFISSGQVGHY